MKYLRLLNELVISAAFFATCMHAGAASFQTEALRIDDVVWRGKTNGAIAIWRINGNATSSSVAATSGGWAVSNDWAIQAFGDFNGDGVADFLWRYVPSGTVSLWLMGPNGTSYSPVGGWGVPSDWKIEAVGDINGDGTADLIWRYTPTGAVSYWLMTKNGQGQYQPVSGPAVGEDWAIQGVADFNGDGSADVLWRRKSTGSLSVWLMTRGSLGQYTPAAITSVSNDWMVQGVGDFNGDGKADILWRQGSTGAISLWQSTAPASGTAFTYSAAAVANAPATAVIQDVGDFNGDGRSDILWRDTGSGLVSVWLMNGTSVQANVSLGTATADQAIQPTQTGAIKLAWQDNSSAETGFIVERSLDGVNGWVEIGRTGSNTTTFTDPSGARRTPYFYRVRAYNATTSTSPSNTAQGTPP